MKRFTAVQWGTPPAKYYNGILMRANPALHEQAFKILRAAFPAGSKVIDVGSGQGAFAARLRDTGYKVTSVDKNLDDFRAVGVKFIRVDFDITSEVDEFKVDHCGQYDVAVGMEVIEHVENPWEYFRFMLSLVRPGGIVFITTPNAESIQSRVEFLFSGQFVHFHKSDYLGSGHINPLTFHELGLIADGVGARIIDIKAICILPWLVISRRVSTVVKSLIASLLRPFVGKNAKGDIICLVLQKPE